MAMLSVPSPSLPDSVRDNAVCLGLDHARRPPSVGFSEHVGADMLFKNALVGSSTC